jgi:hypothetical protein
MTDKEGVLRLQPSGRWAVCRPGREPVEITNSEPFRIEVPGYFNLRLTRMEIRHIPGQVSGGEYYSVAWVSPGRRHARGGGRVSCRGASRNTSQRAYSSRKARCKSTLRSIRNDATSVSC